MDDYWKVASYEDREITDDIIFRKISKAVESFERIKGLENGEASAYIAYEKIKSKYQNLSGDISFTSEYGSSQDKLRLPRMRENLAKMEYVLKKLEKEYFEWLNSDSSKIDEKIKLGKKVAAELKRETSDFSGFKQYPPFSHIFILRCDLKKYYFETNGILSKQKENGEKPKSNRIITTIDKFIMHKSKKDFVDSYSITNFFDYDRNVIDFVEFISTNNLLEKLHPSVVNESTSGEDD